MIGARKGLFERICPPFKVRVGRTGGLPNLVGPPFHLADGLAFGPSRPSGKQTAVGPAEDAPSPGLTWGPGHTLLHPGRDWGRVLADHRKFRPGEWFRGLSPARTTW